MKGLILTYLLTYGGSVVSLFNPWIGLLIYIAFAILKPEALWFWSVPEGNYSRIVAIALLLGWAMHGFGDWRFGKAKPVVWNLLILWGWMTVGSVMAAYPDKAFAYLDILSKIFLPFVVAITLINSRTQLMQLIWLIVLCEGYVAWTFNERYLQSGFFDDTSFSFGGLDNNGVAVTMAAACGLAFFAGLSAAKTWQKLLAFALAGLMVHFVLFSMSRGGMLGVIVVAVVTFLLIPKRPSHIALATLGLAVGLYLAGPSIRKEFATIVAEEEERDESAQSRLDFWRGCVSSMFDEPLGVGLNNWEPTAPRYGLPERPAHSSWFQAGAELGFPGLGLLLGLYTIGSFRLLLHSRRLQQAARFEGIPCDPLIVDCARMVAAGLTGYCVSATFVTLYTVELPYYMILIAAAALKLAANPDSLAAIQADKLIAAT